ncbi:FAD-binding oxidoreductase [uncultured Endozoicomonas sp.]|uniref:FAD-binding oxidoreductase n=1 Tax=uncultured Endozoicomonas sp. TaxID=432652 RepID=UPI00262BF7D8|nr:FAD-binding oxidoreductase [uncultured Endozoicomonas sp.]
MIPQYPATLSSKIMLSTNTIQLGFTFERSDLPAFTFTSGQFIQLIFEKDGDTFKRSYSIANSPDDFQQTGELEVALSFVEGGVASEFFKATNEGLQLHIAGPFGALTLPKDIAGQLVLAGTGTGLAPYRSMIPELETLIAAGVSINVLMGFRTKDEAIYIEDFKTLNGINYRICLTREKILKEEDHEHSGRIQEQFDSLSLNPDSDVAYLCGNPDMIDNCVTLLRDLGFPPRQIKREKYNFSGH